ncbi:MAG: hypothetical protein L3J35_00890 [Bacteroidales bacterium]|nr:hypothetical protein [Bacteroidales bacterium]
MKKLNIPITTFLIISVLFSCKRVVKCEKKNMVIEDLYSFTTAKLIKPAECTNQGLSTTQLTALDSSESKLFSVYVMFLVRGMEVPCKEYILVDTFKNIEITSSNDFNENYKKGESLNDIFNIFIYNDNEEEICCPTSLNQLLYYNFLFQIRFHLLLNEIPDSTRLHEFTVKIELQDTTFINKTLSIYITP